MLRDDKIRIVPVRYADGSPAYYLDSEDNRQELFQVDDPRAGRFDGGRSSYGELVVRLKSTIWVDWDYAADYETKKVVSVRD